MQISIAIPCYKSSKTILSVVEQIRAEFAKHSNVEYQVILVNDGSPDGGATWEVISEIAANDHNITAVNLSRNFGQASAKMAALPYVEGDILVYMDDDGQHAAEGIFDLVDAIQAGADIAIASFTNKQHSVFKRLTSWLNSEMLRLTIQKPRTLQTSSFAAYNRFIIDILKKYSSPYVSMFAFVLQHTRNIVNVPMEHRSRIEGQSGYTLKKLFKLWGDGIFSFSAAPIALIFYAALILGVVGCVLLLVSIIQAIVGVYAFSVLITGAVMTVGALILMGQSLLGQYISRMHLTQNQMPQYIIRDVVKIDSAEKERAVYEAVPKR